MVWLILVSLVLAISVYKIWMIEKSANLQLLKKIRGPKPLPVLGNVFEVFRTPVELFYFGRSLANTFGGISKMKMFFSGVVNLYDPSDIEIVLTSHTHITKGYVYNLVHPWLQEGLLTSTGEKWKRRRKILTPAFHFNILREFCNVFFEQSKKFVDNLDFEINKSETEILPLLNEFTLNSIAETAMGTNLDSVKSDVTLYKQSVYDIGVLIIKRFTQFWQHPPEIYNRTSDGKLHNEVLRILHSFTTNVIKERRIERNMSGNKFSVSNSFDESTSKKRLAMLDLLLSVEEEGRIDESGIREEVQTFMFEGHDTTTIGLLYCLMLLANHQDVQDLIVAELNEIFVDDNDPVSMEKLNKMNYLERCIKESLRLYPSVPYISRHLNEEIKLTNFTLPAGTDCSIHIYDLHRNSKYFPNPDKFDPDRFLPENSAKRHPFAYIPFSAGPRNCIGQKFAILEEKAIISAILRKYKLEPVTKPDDIIFFADIVLRCVDPIKIKFVLRSKIL